MTAPRLWLVRHARPLAAEGLCYGRLDLPAEDQASRSAAAALARALPPQVALVQHSPLQRCELLALDVQALRPDLASNPEPRIAEMDFGAWEGRAWGSIARPEIDAWAADLGTHAPGGGEPLAAMLQRVALALQDAAARAQGGDVVWITHAGVARCVQWLLAHGAQTMPKAQEWTLAAPAFGAWMTLPLPFA
ncbi:MAG: histidine phosphatase family protein [Proteobacteria bacterium]|nr:histidine phosphatase family protein [Pseudomonadota bacterium]MBS0495631.1 histidine phosphatase family protein [Pseudomonadota bacterium]